MDRKSEGGLAPNLPNSEGVPAWDAINRLGYKARIYLASQDQGRGAVLLNCPTKPGSVGIAWWSGDWRDLHIEWCRSALIAYEWAVEHPVVKQFDVLLFLLSCDLRTLVN